MTVLSRAIAFLRGGVSEYNEFERRILAAIGSRLSDEAGARLSEQLSHINFVQRLDGGRQVNAYRLRRGRPTTDRGSRLTDARGELKLASFRIAGALGTENSGKAMLVDGLLFSLEFREPTEHARAEDILRIDVALSARFEQ